MIAEIDGATAVAGTSYGMLLDTLLRRLALTAHIIPLNGDDVKVLENPDDFFQELLAGLSTAQRRVSIASLYFGTGGGREAEFAAALAAAAHDPARPALRMHLLLDALRCTRPTRGAALAAAPATPLGGAVRSSGSAGAADGPKGPESPAAQKQPPVAPREAPMTSTAEMLALSLLQGLAGGAAAAPATAGLDAGAGARGDSSQSSRVRVSLFHTPALRGLLKRVLPPRVSEVVGVMHMKAYVFDDTVLLSGANISSTYLSTRQDRYILIRAAPQLAAFLHQTVDTVGRFSYQLLPAPPPEEAAVATAAPGTAGKDGAAAAGGERGDGNSAGGDMGSAPGFFLASAGIQSALRRRDALLLRLASRSAAAGLAPGEAQGQRPAPSRPHHLQRHRLQRQQQYRLAPCPAGVDPVLSAALFTRQLRQELLQLFVPPDAAHSVLDFAALEAEAAEEDLEAVLVGVHAVHAGAAAAAAVPPVDWQQDPQQQHGAQPDAEMGLQSELGVKSAAVAAAAPPSSGGPDTRIVPLVQAGFAGLRQDERATLGLLSWATQHTHTAPSLESVKGGSGGGSGGRWGSWASGPAQHHSGTGRSSSSNSSGRGSGGGGGSSPAVLLQLASPYLNLARPLEWFLTRQAGSAELELITSSPEANGFFGSKGISGYVPLAYSLLEQRTWRRLTRRRGGGPAWLPGQGRWPLHGRHAEHELKGAGDPGWAHGGRVWRGGAPLRRALQLAWWGGGPGGVRAAPFPDEQSGHITAPSSPAEEAAASLAVGPGAVAAGTAAAGGSGAAAGAPLPARHLLEYCRPGWEFHAKGLWVSFPAAQHAKQEAQQQQQQQATQAGASSAAARWALPAVTAVGSSNFGFRSLHRDLEVQFVVVTRNAGLRKALGAEVAAVKRHCQAVQGDAHFLAPGRRGGALARMAVRLLRGFL